MKNPFLFILFLSGISINSYSQTYYNPSNKVDFTITIKESFKPVDYSKIGRDFNTMIQDELQRRENLKRYYNEIYYQTKNSVYSSTVLTSDNLINSKILMVQNEVIEKLDSYNSLLRGGLMTPDGYESWVKNIYYTYMNSNQVFLQIVQYKYNKDLELGDQTKISEHDKLYNNTLNSIIRFEINNPQKIEFILDGLVYPNRNSTNLYEFVRRSCEGEFENYRSTYEETQRVRLEKENEESIKFEKWSIYKNEIFELRKLKLLESIKEGQGTKIRESELEYYENKLKQLKKSDPKLKDIKPKNQVSFFLMEDENLFFPRLKGDFVEYREGVEGNGYIVKTLILLVKDFWENQPIKK